MARISAGRQWTTCYPEIQVSESPELLLTKNVLAESCLSGYYPNTPGTNDQRAGPSMNIGETIRTYRLQKGMSQGDIEKRTGLLRCYLSRVENGHTIPSLDTLSKIAGAMELPLGQFFADHFSNGNTKHLPALTEDEVRFLTQIRRYSMGLNDSDRKLVLAMVKKMAAGAGK
jgi:transcriptional regulator with XRE-family HTH domain